MTIFERLNAGGFGAFRAPEGGAEGGAAGGEGGAAEGAEGGAGAGEGGASSFDWAQHGLTQDDVGFVQNKGWKGPGDLVGSYRNLEKLTGDPNSLLRLPKEQTPETMRPIFEKLGAGKSVDEYKLPVPDGDSGDFAKTAASWFHELGVPVGMAQKLAEKWNAHVAEQMSGQDTAVKERDQLQLAQLEADWGQNMQANRAIVDRAAEQFGMTPEQLMALKQVMGPGDAMKFMLNIGSKIGVESDFVGGDGATRFGGSPEQARAEIASLRKDADFIRKYTAGDTEARRKMERLHRIAYPEG